MNKYLFGKKLTFNPIDLFGLIISILAVVAVFWSPRINTIHSRIKGDSSSLILTVDVRGLSIENKSEFISEAIKEKELEVYVRNQPTGKLKIVNIDDLSKLKTITPDDNLVNLRFILVGSGISTKNGLLIAGTKVKIGVPILLEGLTYRFKGNVSNIRYK
ncbi:DUF4330 domain-containing protein [Prochlorococcus sp. MIT 1341]|uniref:DUF4330 domain-containing protein n=1 Tax=Prochlorococcus sp. MIT 1341 TaxID=3096221 RepID=UPI002A758521|nr:DUF4330 domain-containing protein [Prochlorococcus sp. MIT 1341]